MDFARWFKILVCLVIVSVCPRTLLAQPAKPIQVLAIMSDTANEQAQALTVALKRVVERDKRYELGAGEFSLEVMVSAMDCAMPPSSQCLKTIGQKLKSERFIWGVMKKRGAEVSTRLELWENGRTAAESSLEYSTNLNDASDDVLLDLARKAFWEMVGVPEGTLELTAGNVSGEVFVDGQRKGAVSRGSARLVLSAGKHVVEVRARGHHAVSGTVTVVPEDSTELVLKPVRRETDQEEAENPAEPESPRDKRSGIQKTLGYVALGVGGALAAGGVYSMIRVDAINNESGFDRYRQGLRSDQDVCDEADKGTVVPGASSPGDVADQCGTARTFQTLEYVFFGAGAASIVTGTVLLLTDSSAERQPAKLRVAPTVAIGPRAGRVDLRVTF
jgi:hypothetical protein